MTKNKPATLKNTTNVAWEEELEDVLSNFDCGPNSQTDVVNYVKSNFYHKSEEVPREEAHSGVNYFEILHAQLKLPKEKKIIKAHVYIKNGKQRVKYDLIDR